MSAVADSLGNLHIGDEENDRIRRISASGIVTTVAGNGQYYYTGEGVPALTSPVEGGGNLAVDKSGNVKTIAGGNAINGFADGHGLAAAFSGPTGVAVDAIIAVVGRTGTRRAALRVVGLEDRA